MQPTQNTVTLAEHPRPTSVIDSIESATTLRATARYLVEHGWVQGAYYDATAESFTPAACLVGALTMVCYGGPVDAPAQMFDHPGFAEFEAALTRLDAILTDRFGVTAYEFNDAKDRTLPEVIEALNMAACACGWQPSDFDRLPDGEFTILTGVLKQVEFETTRQGNPYARAVLDTGTDLVPVLVTPRGYQLVEFEGQERLGGCADRRGDLSVFEVWGVAR